MPVPQTPSSVDAGPAADFKWKGLNWHKRTYLAAIAGNIVINGDGTITCRQTTSGGMEMESSRGGLGYGDYYIVTDTDLAALPAGVVWGGHFPYDSSDAKQEFDNQEASTWGGNAVTFSPHHWKDGAAGQVNGARNGGNAPAGAGNPFQVPSGGPWCHVTKWRPGRVDYFIYRALDASDSSKLYWSGSSTTGIPTPKSSTTQHINLWQSPRTNPKPATVHLVDFAFIPQGAVVINPPPSGGGTTVPTTGKKVTVAGQSFALAGTDIARAADALVVYTDTRTVTSTNVYGAEATVVGGKVSALADRQSTNGPGTAIPRGGYVLSGHGAARAFLLANAKLGAAVSGDVPASNAPTPVANPLIVPSTGSLADVIKAHNALVAKMGA